MPRKPSWKHIPRSCSHCIKPIKSHAAIIVIDQTYRNTLRGFCGWGCMRKYAQRRYEDEQSKVGLIEQFINEREDVGEDQEGAAWPKSLGPAPNHPDYTTRKYRSKPIREVHLPEE